MNGGGYFNFTKEERVAGKKRVEHLFTHGRSMMVYPFRVVYLETTHPQTVPVSILVSIPKKRLRSAAHRNRMKRLTREAYRLNKHLFDVALPGEEVHIDVAFVYVKDALSDFSTVEKSVQKALSALKEQIGKGKW
jgi:ribonuclease P protein component